MQSSMVFLRFLGIWKFPSNLLRYTNLREAHRLLPRKTCLPLTMLSADDEKGATKVLSFSLARLVQAFVNDAIFPFEVHRST